MTLASIRRKTYTDAPELHRNLLLGSLQILFWLNLHPSAWRNQLSYMDPDLRSDFSLAELNREQWRNPALRRLLVMGCLVLPLLAGLLVGVSLLILGQSGMDALVGAGLGAACGIVVSVVGGVTVNVPLGIVGGVLGAMGVGVAVTMGISVEGIFAVGLGGFLTGGVANALVIYGSERPFAKQTGGVVAGVVIGTVLVGLALGMMIGLVVSVVGLVANSIAVGLAFGVGFGGRNRQWLRASVVGVTGGMLSVVADRAAGNLPGVMPFAFTSLALVVLLYGLAKRAASPWAAALAAALGGVGGWLVLLIGFGDALLLPTLPVALIGILLGLTITWSRPILFYPLLMGWNVLLYRLDEGNDGDRPHLLPWHSAFWDELQLLPLPGLAEHLVLVAERDPAEGQAAIEYLNTSHQRWAAREAQIELDARRLERCPDVAAISRIHHSLAAGELAGPTSALLRSFSRISQDVDAALNQTSVYNRRLALSVVEDRLDGLLRELTRSSERYADRFRPIAVHWRKIVAGHVSELAEAVEQRQEIDNPYIIGVPLTEQQEIFVGRTEISARIEQLLLDRRRPPLLLYGQRRTGKTSLLNNLGRLLPSTIVPLFVDLQGPPSLASDHIGLLYNLGRRMADSANRQRNLILPPLSREELAVDPFTRFDEWLEEVEVALGPNTALLALDEFEALDHAITKGRFDEDAVLGMLRHLIQNRPAFKILLSGTHTLDEVQRWASYLINVQVVHIGYLTEEEAHQLVERPVTGFALRYEPDASQRVLDLTRGHPFLVQLLCAEIVALKNEQEPSVRRLACLADVEAAVPKALDSGSFFFADIERNQVDAAGLDLLRFLAAQGEGTVVDRDVLTQRSVDGQDQALHLLIRRELIESTDGGYRFQVELIRRWFAGRAR